MYLSKYKKIQSAIMEKIKFLWNKKMVKILYIKIKK